MLIVALGKEDRKREGGGGYDNKGGRKGRRGTRGEGEAGKKNEVGHRVEYKCDSAAAGRKQYFSLGEACQAVSSTGWVQYSEMTMILNVFCVLAKSKDA